MTRTRPLLFGVLMNELEGTYQSLALRGMKDAARRLGVNLLCFPGHAMGVAYGFDREFNVVYQLARDAQLDAVVALADTFDWALPPGGFEQFMAGFGDIPVVCIGGGNKIGMSAIASDIRGGMERLVDHFLHDHGYRRIAFIKGADGNTDAQHRLDAFIDRHRVAGVPIDPRLMLEGRFDVFQAGRAVDELLDSGVEFEAMLSANDEMALAAMARLSNRDVLVPQEVAVGGYDDVAGQTDIPIPLTSVDQDVPGMAERALEHLIDRVNGKAPVMNLTVPAKLRLRYSCGCGDENTSRRFGHMWVDTQRGDLLVEELSTALRTDIERDIAAGSLQEPVHDDFGRLLRTRMTRSRHEYGAVADLRTALHVLSSKVMRAAQELPREQERLVTRKLLDAQNALFAQEQTLQAEDSLRRHVRSRAMWWAMGPAPDARGFRIDQLLGPLQNALVSLGLKTVLMVLYPKPVYAETWNHFTVPEEVHLAMAVVNGTPVPPDQLKAFASREFLPVSPFGDRAGQACSVFPIFLHSQHFGYLVIDIDTRLDQSYEQVRSDVSGLITSTALIGELYRAGEMLREDLNRQQDANRQLSSLAQHDELTGLLNRRGFFARTQELRRGDETREAVLLVGDLDGLKQINDRYGHAAGDKAIKAAAQVLAATFREEDAVARLGGDEFAVFTHHATRQALPGILQRLQQRLDQHNKDSGDPWTVAFSLGTSILAAGTQESLEEALAAADRLLYVAKRERKANAGLARRRSGAGARGRPALVKRA